MIETLKRWVKNIKWLLNHPSIEVLNATKIIETQYNFSVSPNIKWEEFKAGNEAIKKKGKKNVSKPKCGKAQNSPDGL